MVRQHLPLRLKLTAWFVGIYTVALVALVAFALAVWRKPAREALNNQLHALAEDVDDFIEANPTEDPQVVLAALGLEQDLALVALVDSEWTVTASFPPWSPERSVKPANLETIAFSLAVYDTIDAEEYGLSVESGSLLRRVTIPHGPANLGERLMVAERTNVITETLLADPQSLIIALSIGLLAASVAAWVISRRAVQPMQRVAEMARTLDPGSITKRIQLESSDTEVVRMRDELNGALERIEAGYRAQEGFISNVSHELKTPIAVLLAEAYSLRARGYDNGPVGRYISSSEEELGRLGRLVESFLTLTRTELHFDPKEFGSVDVNDFVLDAIDMAGSLAEVHDVAIDVTLHESEDDESPPAIFGDPQLLATMVVNLVRNAVRFTPKGGSLSIQVLRDESSTRVRVVDDGPGIPADFLPRMFERFAQAPEESRRRRGMGLGLSIAQRIATLHGGSITASNRTEGGSVFEITLPDQPQDAGDHSGNDSTGSDESADASPRNGTQPSRSASSGAAARAQ